MNFGRVTLCLHHNKLPITFEDCGGLLAALIIHVGILPQKWKRQQMNL